MEIIIVYNKNLALNQLVTYFVKCYQSEESMLLGAVVQSLEEWSSLELTPGDRGDGRPGPLLSSCLECGASERISKQWLLTFPGLETHSTRHQLCLSWLHSYKALLHACSWLLCSVLHSCLGESSETKGIPTAPCRRASAQDFPEPPTTGPTLR